MKILVIIPAYNEEENILKTYNSIRNNKDYNFDVMVINDGSTDNTKKVLEDNNIPHINLIYNLGIGGAVQTGYKYAYINNYDIAIQVDGDGQHDISYAKDLIKPIIKKQCNMSIGSRFISKDKTGFKSSKLRRVGIRIISFCIRIVTGKRIFDTTSGFRAVDKKIISVFKDVYPTEYPEPISTVNILKRKFKVVEVPVVMKERQGGKSSIRAWKNVYYMVNVVLSIFIESIKRFK